MVDHLSVNLEGKKTDDFLAFEYNIVHFREMNLFSLEVQKICRTNPRLPKSFGLHKKVNRQTGLFRDVFETVFKPNKLFSDRFLNRDL